MSQQKPPGGDEHASPVALTRLRLVPSQRGQAAVHSVASGALLRLVVDNQRPAHRPVRFAVPAPAWRGSCPKG